MAQNVARVIADLGRCFLNGRIIATGFGAGLPLRASVATRTLRSPDTIVGESKFGFPESERKVREL